MPRYAHVVIDIPILKVDHPFEYAIPPDLTSRVEIGSVVLAPFGRGRRLGYVVDVTAEPSVRRHVDLEDVLEEESVFGADMVSLARFTADYYLSTMGEVLRLALPPGRGRRLGQRISLNGTVRDALAKIDSSMRYQRNLLIALDGLGGQASLGALEKLFRGRTLHGLVRQLETAGAISKKYFVSQPQVDIKFERYARLAVPADEAKAAAAELKRAPRQQSVLKALIEGEISVHKLVSFTGASHQTLASLAQKGLVEVYEESAFREPDFYYPEELPLAVKLTTEQGRAVKAINAKVRKGEPGVFLLQGVTGSGKTEVYLRAVAEALKVGKGAIVLVPEIALTPQTVNRVRLRFGDGVAVLHSGLGVGERYDQWRRIKENELRVVVGARSALFAPVTNLGLIVIDEEQEGAYKQDRNPRYHARTLAVERARLADACVVLGSATPAVESKYLAEQGEYVELRLTKRIEERPLPAVTVVDMRQERKSGNRGVFSLELQEAVHAALESRQKVILFLNRRGFSNFIMCRDCGLVIQCKRCSVSLTYHQDARELKCHHCGYAEPAPTVCPRCGSHDIGYFGVGTERVESDIRVLFPGVGLTRMDTDTTVRRDAHRKKLLEFKAQESGILLGTQMIAKGLDFPDVTLVGIINADTALHLPDFRAAERTFQLLMQVSGRAGRGPQPGRVIVQTYNPDNYAIEAFVKGDYDAFFRQEVTLRDALGYPPFSELINILISAKDEAKTTAEAERIGQLLTDAAAGGGFPADTVILGPSPAPLSRVKNRFRWHVVIKAKDREPVKRFLKANMDRLIPGKEAKEVNVSVDVDPVSLL